MFVFNTGNVLAGYSATLLLSAAYEDAAGLAAVRAALPESGIALLCDVVTQFSAFQASLGLLPPSAVEAHQRLLTHFKNDSTCR